MLAVIIGVLLEMLAPAPVLAGPIEEGAKLLLPFVLLCAGLFGARNPRMGIWMVAVAAATFGTVEGIGYVTQSNVRFLDVNAPLDEAFFTIVPVVNRALVELLHIFLTTGAAAVIWLSAHHRKKAFTWAGCGAFAIAAAVHGFNDAVIAPLEPFLSFGLAMLLLVASYFFWFRARTRVAVPPDAVTTVPRRWLPPLHVSSARNAVPPTSPTPSADDEQSELPRSQ